MRCMSQAQTQEATTRRRAGQRPTAKGVDGETGMKEREREREEERERERESAFGGGRGGSKTAPLRSLSLWVRRVKDKAGREASRPTEKESGTGGGGSEGRKKARERRGRKKALRSA